MDDPVDPGPGRDDGTTPITDLLDAFHEFFSMGLDPQTHEWLGDRCGSGVGWLELDLLRVIRSLGTPTLAETATASRRPEPTTLRMVQELQHRGLLVRRPSRSDRRQLTLHLTREGRRAEDARARTLERLADEVTAGWSPEAVDALSRLFRRYAIDLREIVGTRQH